ncbi:unnamed protein product [Caenorhabditis auriculariae]|uniref:Methylmalonic aciduria and homocystinuria type D protein, mitochondrial n=1 Tax=Caenorhabditis auriculariae TaxID=2777116 RepID=A0A8S1HKJ9_9PELO|nr:unnamed protein product [Caenorhabditis auriculariae]
MPSFCNLFSTCSSVPTSISGAMLTARGPQMRAFTQRVASYSTQALNSSPAVIFVGKAHTLRQNSLLGPSDQQFPLPGDVAFGKQAFQETADRLKQERERMDVFRPSALQKSHCNINTILSASSINADTAHLQKIKDEALREAQQNAPDCPVELTAQNCPRLLKKEMRSLFPEIKFNKLDELSVLNLTQKSEFDMAAWSEAMEEERDKLTASFIMSAQAICTTLRNCGYWADFIDPASGRPYLEAYTNNTLFETNDAYKQMGFRIDDQGCCKVLQHALWGSHAFVGTIFTDAPLDSTIVKDILSKVNADIAETEPTAAICTESTTENCA